MANVECKNLRTRPYRLNSVSTRRHGENNISSSSYNYNYNHTTYYSTVRTYMCTRTRTTYLPLFLLLSLPLSLYTTIYERVGLRISETPLHVCVCVLS